METTYADKLRREELERQKRELEEKRKQEHRRKLTELSSRIEAYQDKTMKQKKKTKRQQFIEHERRSGELLYEIRQITKRMNDYDGKTLGRAERLDYDRLRANLKEALQRLHVHDEDTWKVANRYIEENLNEISFW